MSRLSRFEHNRFVGIRTTFRVYDCDDEEQFAELQRRVEEGDLLRRCQLSAFGPDTLGEAQNRGYRPVQRAPPQAAPRAGADPR